MTAANLLSLLGVTNLVAALAIAVVLLLRAPVRRLAGAQTAYALWLLAPAAVVASLLPSFSKAPSFPALPASRVDTPAGLSGSLLGEAQHLSTATLERVFASPQAGAIAWPEIIVGVWVIGVVAAFALLIARQWRSVSNLGRLSAETANIVRAGTPSCGPAVIGILFPRIVVPADFEETFTPDERRVVLAHEEAHCAGRHTLVKACAQALTCLNWFNPLMHVAVRCIAMDQELVCDDVVATKHPRQRRVYAGALLKAQVAAKLPLGCYWPSGSGDKLKLRISNLAQTRRSRVGVAAGVCLAAGSCAVATFAAWAAPVKPYLPSIAIEAPQPEEPQVAIQQQQSKTLPAAPPQGRAAIDYKRISSGMAIDLDVRSTLPSGKSISARIITFSSQSEFRTINGRRGDGRYLLDVTVEGQNGERLLVHGKLADGSARVAEGDAEIVAGQPSKLQLSNGQAIDILATIRPETAKEVELGKGASTQKPSPIDASVPPPPAPQRDRLIPILEPLTAVEVESSAILPSGKTAQARMTTFSSFAKSRSGSWRLGDGRYVLLPDLERQEGDQVTLSAKLIFEGKMLGSGRITLRSGESTEMTLDNGQRLTVRATVRDETPEETKDARARLAESL